MKGSLGHLYIALNMTIQVTINVALNVGADRHFFRIGAMRPTTTEATTADTTVRVAHNGRVKLNALNGLSGSDVNIGMAVTT